MEKWLIYLIIIATIVISFVVMIIVIKAMAKRIAKLKKDNASLNEAMQKMQENIELINKHNEDVKKLNVEKVNNENTINKAKNKDECNKNMDLLNSLNNKL